MKKTAAICICLILCLLGCGCGKKGTADAGFQKNMKDLFLEKQEITIDCFGDSITWGQFNSKELEDAIQKGEVQPSLDDGGQLFEDYGIYISSVYQSDPTYPEKLEKVLNDRLSTGGFSSHVTCVNDGISGDWLTADSYRRVICEPDVVVILYTGNNFYFDQGYKGTLEINIDAFRENGVLVYLLTYPLYPDQSHTDEFASANKYIQKVARKKNVRLIDTYEYFEQLVKDGMSRKDLFSKDRIHLSEKGYALLGTYVAEVIYADLKG